MATTAADVGMGAPAPSQHHPSAIAATYAPGYTSGYEGMSTTAAQNLALGKNNPLFDSNEALNLGLLDDPLPSASQSNMGSLSSIPNALMLETASSRTYLPDATTTSTELDYAITAAFPSLAQSLGPAGSHLYSGSMPAGLDFGFSFPSTANSRAPSSTSHLNDVDNDPAPRRKRSARGREISYAEQTSPTTETAVSMSSSPVTMEEEDDDDEGVRA
jgi:hypothetical protein